MRPAPLVIITLLALALTGCPAASRDPRQETEFLLGTTCTLTLYQAPPRGIFQETFELVRDLERRMSVHLEDSEVSRINRAAGLEPVSVSADTFAVIREGLRCADLSNGAFDITVGPLVQLWGIGTEQARVPSPEEISRALSRVDYREVALEESSRSVFLKRKGMMLDLGGIAKGYAADRAAAHLQAKGIRRALLDFGGNIYALGNRPNGGRWRVGLQDPSEPRGVYLGILEVSDTSVVTSGAYERFFEQGGVRYHHILDTRTGRPVDNGVLSTTVVFAPSVQADALSTALFVLGPEKGLALAASLPGVEAMVVVKDGRVYRTPGIDAFFRITRSPYHL